VGSRFSNRNQTRKMERVSWNIAVKAVDV
jgi:hypothetical protein